LTVRVLYFIFSELEIVLLSDTKSNYSVFTVVSVS